VEPGDGGGAGDEIDDGAPPVVAIVVTCNPGDWFVETLAAFRDQDYPNLAVLVIDAASTDDPLPVIAEVLPDAYVRRLGTNPGYGAATNRALRIVQGASHLVLCHDDVAPEPDAIRQMVAEAFRSNAGMVTPKLVDWSNPRQLLQMGGTVDMTGAFVAGVDRNDLDQGQHDMASEVFVANGGFVLVRSDLFAALGGFDPAMVLYGEDVDLSWRAQIAGARIVTAPKARVRHLEAASRGLRPMDDSPLLERDDEGDAVGDTSFDALVLRRRHRLRTVLKMQRGPRLVLVAALQLLVNAIEIVYGVLIGRRDHAGAVAAAWSWNLSHWRGLMKLRRQAQHLRVVDNRRLSSQMAPARTRVAGVIRADWEEWREALRAESRSRELSSPFRHLPVIAWLFVLVMWALGSRRLIGGDLPVAGQFALLHDNPLDALRQFLGRFPGYSFGAAVTASPSHLFTAVVGAVFFGAMGTLRTALILGMLPLGAFGMARLARPLKSQRARVLVVLAYGAIPLPYESIAAGRWDGLICYAAAPWLLSRLMRVHGARPFVGRRGALHLRFGRSLSVDDDEPDALVVAELSPDAQARNQLERAANLLGKSSAREVAASLPVSAPLIDRMWFLFVRRVVPLGLLLGLVGSFAPQFLLSAASVALALVVGGMISGEPQPDRARTIGVTSAALGIALLLLVPAIIGSEAGLGGFIGHELSAASPDGLGRLLGFHVSDSTAWAFVIGLLIAGLPALLIGTDWRFQMSVRLWSVIFLEVFLTWLGSHGWLGPVVPDPHVMLAPGAVALALNVGLTAAVFHDDLRRTSVGIGGQGRFSFDWRHSFAKRYLLPIVAYTAVFAAVVPLVGRTFDGAWELPKASPVALLSWMPDPTVAGSYRVLWLGDGALMPGGPRRLGSDLAGAVTVDGPGTIGLAPPDTAGRAEDEIASAVATARAGRTVQLGASLAPYSVRYVVVPLRPASDAASDAPVEDEAAQRMVRAPADLLRSLSEQLDLRSVESDESLAVYENPLWLPIRTALTPSAVLAARAGDTPSVAAGDVSGAKPVLPNADARNAWTGNLEPGEVFVSEAASSGWRLSVNGDSATRTRAFGWANSYAVESGGRGSLRYRAPASVQLMQAGNLLLWLAFAYIAVRYRPRRGRYA